MVPPLPSTGGDSAVRGSRPRLVIATVSLCTPPTLPPSPRKGKARPGDPGRLGMRVVDWARPVRARHGSAPARAELRPRPDRRAPGGCRAPATWWRGARREAGLGPMGRRRRSLAPSSNVIKSPPWPKAGGKKRCDIASLATELLPISHRRDRTGRGGVTFPRQRKKP